MRKLLVLALMVLLAQGVMAKQWFIGGGVGYSSIDDVSTAYTITPEVGYMLNDKWDVGLDLGYSSMDYDDDTLDDLSRFTVAPFARYNLVQFGSFNVLLKGSVGLHMDEEGDVDGTLFFINVLPMVTYDISESVSLFANLNFLGVNLESGSGDLYDGTNFGFGVDADDAFNTNNFQVGFVYKF